MQRCNCSGSGISIHEVIGQKLIETHFQPILSAKKGKIIGLEALSRLSGHPGGLISPPRLFSMAETAGVTLELDRLCREKAIETFTAVGSQLLLFLNLDTGVIDTGILGSGHLLDAVRRAGLSPYNVVIEIVEAKSTDICALQQFIRDYKSYGFTIAMDDMGNRYSNLDRILQIKPDILKIDRWLCQGIESDYYKQEIFKSLIGLSRKIGALVVAEGVETKAEAMMTSELGADLLQGYYFARPQPVTGPVQFRQATIFSELKQRKIQQVRQSIEKQAVYEATMGFMLQQLAGVPATGFEAALSKMVGQYPEVEYLYIMDRNGMQVTDSVCCRSELDNVSNCLFQVAGKGTDQSLKDYYLYIIAGKQSYISEPYMSLATGRMCITSSAVFSDCLGYSFILCADFDPQEDCLDK